MPLQFRRVEPKDKEDVFQLHVLALRDVSTKLYLSGSPDADNDLKDIEGVYLRNQGDFIVAESDGRLVGMGAIRRVDDTTAEVKRMRVHPDFQRQGIGQQILDRLLVRARELGYHRLILDTTTEQVAAMALYRKNGFTEFRRASVEGLVVIFLEKMI